MVCSIPYIERDEAKFFCSACKRDEAKSSAFTEKNGKITAYRNAEFERIYIGHYLNSASEKQYRNIL